MTHAKILLVEDHEADRYVFTATLKTAGHEVVAVANADEALEALGNDAAIAVLVTDIRLPKIHGFLLARMALARKPELKVVYITSADHLPSHEAGLADGPIFSKSEADQASLLQAVYDAGRSMSG